MELVKKEKIRLYTYRVLLCLIGSFILAFGTGVFLTPANVVAGGISGIGIIINHFVEPLVKFNVVDIIVWILNIFFLILAIIFMGKRFTLHTLISTFAYPAFLTLITRTHMLSFISDHFVNPTTVLLLIAGLLGGLCVGAGCALTFLGDGSTGGVDVLCFILAKYTGIKQSFSSFVVDASVIIVGMALIRDNVVASLIGILSALMSALTIHFVYVQTNNNYVADIITEKTDEISKLIVKTFNRTTTIIDAIGSYSKSKKKLVRFVMEKRELPYFRDAIIKIDPKAFVTITPVKMVLGEGFIVTRPSIRKKYFSFLGPNKKKKKK